MGHLLLRLLILVPLGVLAAMFPAMSSPEARQRQRALMADKMARDSARR
jgi:hypothetical protein